MYINRKIVDRLVDSNESIRVNIADYLVQPLIKLDSSCVVDIINAIQLRSNELDPMIVLWSLLSVCYRMKKIGGGTSYLCRYLRTDVLDGCSDTDLSTSTCPCGETDKILHVTEVYLV